MKERVRNPCSTGHAIRVKCRRFRGSTVLLIQSGERSAAHSDDVQAAVKLSVLGAVS